MGDIVERLNTLADIIMMGEKISWGSDSAIMREAAAEITRLREENARLLAALKPFAEKAADVAPDDGSIGGCLCAPTLLRSYFFNAAVAIREGGRDE